MKVAEYPFTSDDHGNPAMVIDNDGYIHVMFHGHGGGMVALICFTAAPKTLKI